MTLIEYGKLNIKSVEDRPEMIITCTLPEMLLKVVADLEIDLSLTINAECEVFVDIPEEAFNK